MFRQHLWAALALIVVHSMCRVTQVGLSHAPLQWACTCIKGQSSCMVISIPCNVQGNICAHASVKGSLPLVRIIRTLQ